MADDTKPPRRPGKAAEQTERERRLAEALRQNLRRRKEAARGSDAVSVPAESRNEPSD